MQGLLHNEKTPPGQDPMMNIRSAGYINDLVCRIVPIEGNDDLRSYFRENKVRKGDMVPIDATILGGDEKDSM
jgi:hypothetical protein